MSCTKRLILDPISTMEKDTMSGTEREVSGRRPEKEVHSIYVNGLPSSVSKKWLQQIFGPFGVIVDMYISRKTRQTSSLPFAFARYRHGEEAGEAIKAMNGKVVDSCRLYVSEARLRSRKVWKAKRSMEETVRTPRKEGKFSMRGVGSEMHRCNVLQSDRSSGANFREVKKGHHEPECITVVQGEVCRENVEWLSKSLVAESFKPINVEYISSRVFAKSVEWSFGYQRSGSLHGLCFLCFKGSHE